MLSIQLFGSPQVILDQRPVTISRRKSRALLYYLAAHRRPLPRERLLAFFWPDADRASGQQVLRTTLHGLRKALGTSLNVETDSMALAPESEVDVHAFEAALTAPTPALSGVEGSNLQLLTAALDLYRGDLLADFTLPDSPEFDDWVAVERERYRRLFVRGLLTLSQLREEQRDFPAALAALDRALSFDPLQEDVQRSALRLHYRAGDRAGAIRRYAHFRKLLDDEMGVPPMSETRALYDAIITDTLQIPAVKSQIPISKSQPPTSTLQPPMTNTLPFAGRAAELQALHEAAAAHKLALIEGEPGIGKTRLAEEFMRTSDALNLIGRARELEHAMPYQPVIEALRGLVNDPTWPSLRKQLTLLPLWQAEVAHLLPEFAATQTDAPHEHNEATPPSLSTHDESRLWEGVFQFLLAFSRQRPVMCLLDDAHWADDSTVALLGYLVRQIMVTQTSITLIATTRPIAPRSPLAALRQALMREGRVAYLVLQRLSAQDTTHLAQQLSPTYAYALADWFVHASEGNPYILNELVREARENEMLAADGTLNLSALSTSPMVPQTVYSLIQSRLARLSDDARRVLDVAVAVGREFEFAVVARAAGLSENAVLDALDELRAAALITPLDGMRYTFDHTLTMEVAYREAGEPRHRLFHRRVAEATEVVYRDRLDAVAGLLAWHFAEGLAPERAAPYALRAGQLAARLPAWKEAIAFYQQALAAERDTNTRFQILMALGDAHAQIGEAAQAAESFRAALDLAYAQAELSQINTARLALAPTLFSQARFAEAIALAQQVVDSGDEDHRVAAEFTLGAALSIEGADLAGAAEHLQRAISLRKAQADPVRLAQIKFELGGVEAQQGNLERAVELYRETLDAARLAPDDAALTWRILAYNNLAYHLHLLNDAHALDYAREGLNLAREKGALFALPFLLSTMGEIMLAQNDLDAAEAHFNEGLALAERLSVPERITGLTANLGLVAGQRGQTALAIHHLSTALARADALGLQHLAAQIRLWLAPLLPPQEARARLAEARAIIERGSRRRLMDELIKLEQQLK